MNILIFRKYFLGIFDNDAGDNGDLSEGDKFMFREFLSCYNVHFSRRKFWKEILYKNIPIIAIQHSKMHFLDTFGDFSHTVK